MKAANLNAKTDKTKLYAPLLFLLAALLPEYFAPVLSIVIFILTLKKSIAEKSKPQLGKLGLSILIFVGWAVVSSFWSSSIISSLASIGLWLLMLTGYYVFTQTVTDEGTVDKIMYFGCVSAGVSGFIGITQMVSYHFCRHTGGEWFKLFNPLWRFLDRGIEKLVVLLPDFISSNMAAKSFHTFSTRSCGTFSNPLFFATFCVFMLPFAVYVFLCSADKKRRWLGFVCCLLDVGGLALSYSRGPYLFAVAVFVLLLLHGGKKSLKLLGLGSLSLCALAIFAKGSFKRLLSLVVGEDVSVSTRKLIWNAAFDMIRQKPIFGYGTGFDNVRSRLHEIYSIKQPHAHNIFLEIWLENGVIGVVLLIAVFVIFFVNAFRLARLGSKQRSIAVTLFASVAGFLLCGMTDCIFYGLKPLQYLMLVLGFSQAVFAMYLNKKKNSST